MQANNNQTMGDDPVIPGREAHELVSRILTHSIRLPSLAERPDVFSGYWTISPNSGGSTSSTATVPHTHVAKGTYYIKIIDIPGVSTRLKEANFIFPKEFVVEPLYHLADCNWFLRIVPEHFVLSHDSSKRTYFHVARMTALVHDQWRTGVAVPRGGVHTLPLPIGSWQNVWGDVAPIGHPMYLMWSSSHDLVGSVHIRVTIPVTLIGVGETGLIA